VRVLLDENLPHDLISALVGHSVSTVQGFGWEGTKNGALLKPATGLIDAFVTIDGNLQYQQIVAILPLTCRDDTASTTQAAISTRRSTVRGLLTSSSNSPTSGARLPSSST
jgi:hypothetical protein